MFVSPCFTNQWKIRTLRVEHATLLDIQTTQAAAVVGKPQPNEPELPPINGKNDNARKDKIPIKI